MCYRSRVFWISCFLVISLVSVFFYVRSPGTGSKSADSAVGIRSEDAAKDPFMVTSTMAERSSGNPGLNSTSTPKWTILEERMRMDGEGLVVRTHPNGAESLHLGGRFKHFTTGVRGEDGKLVIQCFSGYAALEDSLAGRLPVNKKQEDSLEIAAF